ncbi:MAG TPA: class I tRNA ligase family protein [Candidatus Paceibacterota bacterium]
MLKNTEEFSLPKLEKQILDSWKKNDIFRKTLENRSKRKTFNFYEGPPTANGKPGLHHVLARSFKDIVLRYKTMDGFFVPRKGGWDTHGLPVELQVEKRLGLKSKKDIEKYGIEKFNKKCRESVWEYKTEWENITERMGFWLDLKNPYITYEPSYMETLWWIISQAWKKKLLYKGHKVVPWCVRCGTALSSHEVAQGYKEVNDKSVFIKFKLRKNQKVGRQFITNDKTYILSWTTTPWTLPGNVALAVGKDINYLAVSHGEGGDAEIWILAKDIYMKEEIFKGLGEIKVLYELTGKELLKLSYEQLFSVKTLKNNKSHKIYDADFVTTVDGTGVVHTAVMYGDDDYKLGVKNGLPQHHTVDENGKFSSDVPILRGKYVRSEETNQKIIGYLVKNGYLLKTESYKHDYPFCWRCDTPLLYYAKDSWFIAMSKLRDRLLESNSRVNWVPETVGRGRFGEWIKDVKDWAISRARYWGTPLPIWECKNGHIKVVGQIEDLGLSSGNKFFILRHGEAEHNVRDIIASGAESGGKLSHLTKKGIKEAKLAGEDLNRKKIDLIISSPYKRTMDTAKIISEITGAKVLRDQGLKEIDLGKFNWKKVDQYRNFFKNKFDRFDVAPQGGENLNDVTKRVVKTIIKIDSKYRNKNILIVGHGDPLWMLEKSLTGTSNEGSFEMAYLKPGEWKEIKLLNTPYDNNGNIDLHRPFIDKIILDCDKCKEKMARVKDVVDVWFDSGAMPFASWHYPKEYKDLIDDRKKYPADYIVEGMDQTRGWFYTLLAVATILDNDEPYRNVISLGLIHDKFGQKMSKSKGNVVDPWAIIEKYGVDAVRWYFYTVNPPGEQKNFDEADLGKVSRKIFSILYNSFVFYNTSEKSGYEEKQEEKHVLDRWVIARLHQTIKSTTSYLDGFEIGLAAREIEGFIDDLSRWYIRRSRKRPEMASTLKVTLLEVSKLMAPFSPFFADALYKSVGGIKESVHMEDWPKSQKDLIDKELIVGMEQVRKISTSILAKRSEAGIKVRQPLGLLKVNLSEDGKGFKVEDKELLDVLREEINVKNVVLDKNIDGEFVLDTEITPALKEEGMAREITRIIQGLRQEANLKPKDRIDVFIKTESQVVSSIVVRWDKEIKEVTGADRVRLEKSDKFKVETETHLEGESLWVAIKKV